MGGNAPEVVLIRALEVIAGQGGVIRRVSRFYRTPAFPAGSGADYVNAAAEIEFSHGAQDVLSSLHEIEHRFGRRRLERWGPRTLDLDLLGCGDLVVPDAALVRRWMDLPPELQPQAVPDRLLLPHPRLHERAFVLIPLVDIAPDWRHPILDQSAAQLLDALPRHARADIKAIPTPRLALDGDPR